MFTNDLVRKVVLRRLKRQLVRKGFCARNPTVTLCLAAGHIHSRSNRPEMEAFFAKHKWLLFDESWIRERIQSTSTDAYENDVIYVAAKLLLKYTT